VSTSGELRRGGARVRDLDLRWIEQGRGPLVLLCHGFPECSWSWRHQLPALAAAGFRAVAPDLRGYGDTVGPTAPHDCDAVALSEDLVALVQALGHTSALLVGHDFGALLAWHAAVLRPELFRAVACLSVGYPTFLTGARPPMEILRERTGQDFHYILYFQEPGVAEKELEADVRRTLLAVFWASSGEGAQAGAPFVAGTRSRFLEGIPARMPSWLAEEDLDVYVRAFERSGFGGPLSWYRAFDIGWQRLGDRRGADVEVPALFMAGAIDPVLASTGGLLARMRTRVRHLEQSIVLDGCGHWIQQERPKEVSAALVDFAGRHV